MGVDPNLLKGLSGAGRLMFVCQQCLEDSESSEGKSRAVDSYLFVAWRTLPQHYVFRRRFVHAVSHSISPVPVHIKAQLVRVLKKREKHRGRGRVAELGG